MLDIIGEALDELMLAEDVEPNLGYEENRQIMWKNFIRWTGSSKKDSLCKKLSEEMGINPREVKKNYRSIRESYLISSFGMMRTCYNIVL